MKRILSVFFFSAAAIALVAPAFSSGAESWGIESQKEWEESIDAQDGITMKDGAVSPTGKTGTLKTIINSSKKKRTAASLLITQSPIWQNWEPVENIGPANLADAPVLLTMGPDNYWIFGRYSGPKKQKKGVKGEKIAPFTPESTTLEGFDIPLQTTKDPIVFNAPGGLKPGQGGYHAFQSRDMKNWVHHGPVTDSVSRWVTTAEYVDGKTYIYYDYPNDQDPHLYIDSDLTDGEPGENKGIAFADPSDGSDCAFIRDAEGNFHVIYEDWSPINANKRSWDSPLAGRATSKDGIKDFKIQAPVVDRRTNPTGVFLEYKHPHWLQHPDFTSDMGKYEVHEPEQDAYGDWAAISIGGQYYLFGDFDPAGGHQMSVGWFTSSSLDEEFTWCDEIGEGHPDPDICFAEGQFYLATQQRTDYISSGPWVETVSARVGVDTNNDRKIDHWTDWQDLHESYDYTPGFAKQVQKTPAKLDLSDLPEGYGFQVELKLEDSTENKSKPILESLTLSFD